MEEIELVDIINVVESVNIYVDGNKLSYSREDGGCNSVLDELKDIFKNSREMPAFGVALNDETLIAIKSGVWVELVLDKMYTHNEMPFECLMIEVDKYYTGFNILRMYDGEYNGRCFYVDLLNGKTMENLYNVCKGFVVCK